MKFIGRKWIFCLGLMLLAMVSSGQEMDTQALLVEAENAYKAKDYKSAITHYNNVLKTGEASLDLHFNLATTYYQDGQLAMSVLHYLKVLKQKEGHTDAKINLQIVNDQRASDVVAIPDFFLVHWWRSYTGIFPGLLWSILFFIALGIALYIFKLWLGEKKKRKRRLSLLIISMLLSGLFFLAAWSKTERETKPSLMVNKEATTVYKGPDKRSGEVVEIIEGEKLKVLDQREGWYKVSLVNKEIGWIAASALLEV